MKLYLYNVGDSKLLSVLLFLTYFNTNVVLIKKCFKRIVFCHDKRLPYLYLFNFVGKRLIFVTRKGI